MKTIEIDGKKYEVVGEAEDGLPILRGTAETVVEGHDADGNEIRSVKINVPPVTIGVTPGEVQ